MADLGPGPIDRDPPAPPPIRDPETRDPWPIITALLRPLAWLVGALFLAMILIRGHA
jgi:hypothetical protein